MTQHIKIEQVKTGVHWFWWVFWLFAFWPGLIVVAMIHFSRKDASDNVVSAIIQADEDDIEIRKMEKELKKAELQKQLDKLND